MCLHHAVCYIFQFFKGKFHKKGTNRIDGVMHKYSLAVKFPLLCQLLFFLPIFCNVLYLLSLDMHIKSASKSNKYSEGIVVRRKLPIGVLHFNNITRNIKFVYDCLVTGAATTFLTWLGILLLMSGDVHPNPGQNSTSSHSSSSSTSNDSFSFINTLNLQTPILCTV